MVKKTDAVKLKTKKKTAKPKVKKQKRARHVVGSCLGVFLASVILPTISIPVYNSYILKRQNEEFLLKRLQRDKGLLASIKSSNNAKELDNATHSFYPDDGSRNLIESPFDKYEFKVVEKLKNANINEDWEAFNKFLFDNFDQDIYEDIYKSLMMFFTWYHDAWSDAVVKRIVQFKYSNLGVSGGYFKQYTNILSDNWFVDRENFIFKFRTDAKLIAKIKSLGVDAFLSFAFIPSDDSQLVIDDQTKGLTLTKANIDLESFAANGLSPRTTITIQTNNELWIDWYDKDGKTIPLEERKQAPGIPISAILYSLIYDRDNKKGYIEKYFFDWAVKLILNFLNFGYYEQFNSREGKKN
ncbi:hypothetical protein [Mycoplasma sp. E35C]|uniref:hypothetical protein n=1 Tax=Mycoplasma sp. E35C TaxID=2801918 RepID=UPI001CA3F618|nr:hypothetical protein [Mycoplasma sp. E35C]QZX48824.1 hypothetical protein JJE79_02065 [Mycoplasma sp. E35C]